MKKTFFCDFDGTISDHDTCLMLMETFCSEGWQEFDAQWIRKEISSAECARKTFALISAGPQEIKEMLDRIKIDPFFIPFVETLHREGHQIFILSDGYDFLMDHVLEKYGLLHLVRYTNRMLLDQMPYDIACPFHNPACGQCGVCKKNLIRSLRQEDRQTVYIGDGYSDTCACQSTEGALRQKRPLAFLPGPKYSGHPLPVFCRNNSPGWPKRKSSPTFPSGEIYSRRRLWPGRAAAPFLCRKRYRGRDRSGSTDIPAAGPWTRAGPRHRPSGSG